ncbi:hypothetical protein ACJ41O_000713 [Fusarium nematophilum]
MELRDYPGPQDYDTSPRGPANWQPSSPSIARKPLGAAKVSSPSLSPETPYHQAFPQASPSYYPRQADHNVDTSYGGAPTPLGIWEPSLPQGPGAPYGSRPQHRREDSQASLLLSPYSNDGAGAQRRGSPPAGRDGGTNPPTWGKRTLNWWVTEWKPSWSMYTLVFCGIAFAIGHHFFYKGLHGKQADDQQSMLRYGAALAFLSKACFLNAVVLAFRQRVLMMIRRKMLSLATLDSLFAASEDLTALFNWEAWVNAKFAMALTIFIWTSPLIVIFTAYTLTVEPLRKEEFTKCAEVRTLNFSHEQSAEWRIPIRMNDYIELSVSLWNTTGGPDGVPLDPDDPNEFDYWDSPSPQFRQVATKTAYLQQAVMRQNAPEEICGAGWNCSYKLEFTGPGYRCQQLASGVGDEVKKLNGAECPFNTSILLPKGDHSYIAELDRGDYKKQQIKSGKAGKPNQDPPYPKNFGALRTEPVLWLGYAEVEDRSKKQPENSSVPGWNKAYTPTIFGCEHYETKYTVQFNYSGGIQTHNVTKREFMRRVVDTTFVPDGKDSDKRLMDRTKAVPEENYIFPQNVNEYRIKMAYHAIGSLLREFMKGTIKMPHYVVDTKAIETRLVDRLNYLPVEDFPDELQGFYEEILLSFLSDPQFIAVSWAYDPTTWSGRLKGGSKTKFPCVRWRTRNCYYYSYQQLWGVYAISMAMTIIAVASGVSAIEEDALMNSLSFSAIVAATRGTSLDKLRWERGAEIKKNKIGYGLVSGQYTFGVEGDVDQDKGKSTSRSPAISVMNWGDRAARRMSYAVLNRK